MAALIDTTLELAKAAGDLAGVPYLATAVTLVQCIKDNCERIQIHKHKCRRLSDKAVQLTETFREQGSRIADSELRIYVDEVENVLGRVNGRTNRWARYGSFHAFMRDAKIAEGIDQCMADLDTALSKFHINAAVVLNYNQEEARLTLNMQSDKLEQMLDILNNPEKLRQIFEQKAPDMPVAERLMDIGKRQLQVLREQHGDPSQPVPSETYKRTEHGMSMVYSMTGIPPTIRTLDGEVTRRDEIPYVGGVYSDIWVGYWLGDQKVALKTMRGVVISPEKAKKRFETEMNVWSKLCHPNIQPFLGIVTDLGHAIHMVSPWQDNGNVLDFINKYEKADRLHLLSGAADGLAYLHSRNLIHGNVRCANILVAVGGEAVICDFGVSKVREETSAQSGTMTLTTQGSARWIAPELLDATVSSPTAKCDVYSFSMTMLECFTLQYPFFEIRREIHVITKMSKAKGTLEPKRPEAPDAVKWITDEVWALMRDCWVRDPVERPVVRVVADRMKEIEMAVRRSAVSSPVNITPSPSVLKMPTPSVPTPVPTLTAVAQSPIIPGTPSTSNTAKSSDSSS